ncbi:uncharacterized protein LOC135385762 isoform X2 [Ornithodoros turicata]
MTGSAGNLLTGTVIPLLVMVIVPNFLVCLIYFVVSYGSSFEKTPEVSLVGIWVDAWTLSSFGSLQTWTFLVGLATYAVLSVILLPGKAYYGPISAGHAPKYYRNGFLYYIITMVIAGYIILYQDVRCWSLYLMLPTLVVRLTIMGTVACFLLYLKGRYAPSLGESSTSGHSISDFFWGLEKHPRLLGGTVDVKQCINSRFGMMLWQLIVLVCWKASVEDKGWNSAMTTSALLQTVYIARFFWWEDGYMHSLGITEDRAGFCIIYGCMVGVPTLYPLTAVCLVEQKWSADLLLSLLNFVLGVSAIVLNYWADYQRQVARATNGKCTIWGHPPRIIKATYRDSFGKQKISLLLVSGFWSWSRHPNYFFEILSALLWSVPAGFRSVIPYTYLVYLTVCLIHRSHRDDAKCCMKYKAYWKEYCWLVRYRMVPFIF